MSVKEGVKGFCVRSKLKMCEEVQRFVAEEELQGIVFDCDGTLVDSVSCYDVSKILFSFLISFYRCLCIGSLGK